MADEWNFVDSDGEEGEEGQNVFAVSKSLLIAMIDCTPEMFEPWQDGEDETAFKAAIKCCHAIWRSKVVSSPKTKVCLILVGSEKSLNPSNFDNLYLLQNLSTVKVAMIEELIRLKGDEGDTYLNETIGKSENYDLKDAFWLAKMIIDEGKAATYQKKIMYFTRNDNPHERKPTLQQEVVKKFQDIGKVELTLVPFNAEFDLKKFYYKLGVDEANVLTADNLESLTKVLRVKQRVRRPYVRVELELAPDVKFGVAVYSFIREAKKPTPTSVHKGTNEPIQKTINQFHKSNAMPVLKTEERTAITVGGSKGSEQVITSKAEIKETRQLFESGISVLGFMNSSDVDLFAYYRSSGYFLYPDEERISGSKDLFVALLKRCHTLKKIALVKLVLTRGSPPKIGCLIPSVDDKTFPQGFHVFIFPFSDEMRSYDFEFKNPPTNELVGVMEKIVKKITNKKFDVLDVHNPALQHHWRELERIALDAEEDEEEITDYTEPNEDLMKQRLGQLIRDFNVEGESCSSVFGTQSSTRSVFTTKPQIDMAMEVKHQRVPKLTMSVLKDFLESHRIKTLGLRKADLVEAVYKYFEGK